MKSLYLSELACRTEAPTISWLMHAALWRPQLISLAAGFTDNESLPVADVRAMLAGILRANESGQAALQYGTTAGDPALRRRWRSDCCNVAVVKRIGRAVPKAFGVGPGFESRPTHRCRAIDRFYR